MARSLFSRRRAVQAPAQRQGAPLVSLDHRGLDLSTPYDVMRPEKSPFAKNFRIFAQEEEDRRVAITSRKGSGAYSNAVGDAAGASFETVTGAADKLIGMKTEWKAQSFAHAAAVPLRYVEINIKKPIGTSGHLIVQIYTDNNGKPGTLAAESGITDSTVTDAYSYVRARFIEAPTLAIGTYWIVVYMQDDGIGYYHWASSTAATTGLTSNNAGMTWDTTTYALNYKTRITGTEKTKGIARFAPTSGVNKTLMAVGTGMYSVNDTGGALTNIATGYNASASKYYFAFADDKAFWVNGYDNLRYWDGTSVFSITHTQLPVLRYIAFHKNVLWGVSASDPNKLHYSVAPAEVDALGNTWYRGWLSTSIGYVPAPKASDPITAIVPFQDTLVVFTKTTKWVIYGSNAGDIQPRQATGSKGAVAQNAVYADENFVYFASDDGIYRFNGASDELISEAVQPEYSAIGNKDEIVCTKWKRQIRFYYPSATSAVNNKCLLFHTVLQEWMMDTDAYVSYVTPFTDSNDNGQLVEALSTAPLLVYAETQDNNLGKAIDFEYKCKPDSMGNPAMRKRIVKFFPLLEGEGTNYPIQVGIDRDRQEDPLYTDVQTVVGGALIGQFDIGDGSVVARKNEFQPKRIGVSGYGYYWQVSVKRKAINNPVQFIGYVLSIRTKKL